MEGGWFPSYRSWFSATRSCAEHVSVERLFRQQRLHQEALVPEQCLHPAAAMSPARAPRRARRGCPASPP
eukprot:4868980-Pyramimonas_sp.AAC.1